MEDYTTTLCGKLMSKKYHPTRNHNKKLREIKPTLGNDGYLRVCLYCDNKRNDKLLHRLIAENFIPNPENKPQVNHKNGVKTDCRVNNLEWSTEKENTQHAVRIGLMDTKGESHWNSRLTEYDIMAIKKDDRFQRVIAKEYQVSQAMISCIKNNKRWEKN